MSVYINTSENKCNKSNRTRKKKDIVNIGLNTWSTFYSWFLVIINLLAWLLQFIEHLVFSPTRFEQIYKP